MNNIKQDVIYMQRKLILVFFILIKFFIQYNLISPTYDLQRDEYLHLDQGHHLAWGYLSVPPVTSWISYLINLLGNSVFWVKFFPALFGALTILVVWKSIEALKGNLFALIFGASCITFSVLFRLNMFYQPNSLDVLCWTLIFFFVIKYINTYQPKWLYYIAISFAIGFLNKYNIVFLVAALLPSLLLSPERKVLKNKHLYYSIILSALMISPNLFWQYNNNFPVINHLEELSKTQLVHVNRWSFFRSQILYFPGTFIVILLGLFGLLKIKQLEKYRLFFWFFFISISIFVLLKAKDYYAIGIYPIYFAFGSVYISSLLNNKAGQYIKPSLIILVIILYIPTYRIFFPNKTPEQIANHPEIYQKLGLLTWEDGKTYQLPQDFADMLGWKELAKKVDSVYLSIPNQQYTLVLCDNYGQAGAINYYSKLGIRAASFHADYVNWFDFNVPPYQNLIRVKDSGEQKAELKETSPFFQESMISDSIINTYSREKGTIIFRFVGAKIDIKQRLKNEIKEH